MILRDWRGDIIAMGASNYSTASAVMAESRSLRDGLQAALRIGVSQLQVEGDNMVVIGAFNNKIQVPWQIKNIIQDIHLLVQQIRQVWVSHIYREANMAKDWLSRFGHSFTGSWSATKCDNPILRQIVKDDRIGRTLVRRGV
uniref:RNase H type-1 domain-containing protein n=1 Tax=Opuntia streptacantha TaxID=393608 RepID=A0A7C8ZNI5_OPUST